MALVCASQWYLGQKVFYGFCGSLFTTLLTNTIHIEFSNQLNGVKSFILYNQYRPSLFTLFLPYLHHPIFLFLCQQNFITLSLLPGFLFSLVPILLKLIPSSSYFLSQHLFLAFLFFLLFPPSSSVNELHCKQAWGLS